jgi:predicted phosphodiesterase
MAVLAELRGYGKVAAVQGNVDEHALRMALPARLELDLDGRRVGVIHDGGRRIARLARLRRTFPAAEAVIFGHSHIPLHETDTDGFQIFNPGSPTDRRRALRHTMGMARVDRSRLSFELIDLD